MKNNKLFFKLFLCLAMLLLATDGFAQNSDAVPAEYSAFEHVAVLDSTKLDFDNLTIFPGYGLFVRENESGEYCALDSAKCPDFKHLKFLDNIWYDQVMATDNHTFVRNGQQVYDLGKDKCELVVEFDSVDYRLFSANDTSFLVVNYQDDGCLLYRYSLSHGNAELLAATDADIYGAEQFNDEVWFVAGNTLYKVTNNVIESQLSYESEDFRGMTLTPKGILVYTSTKVALFDGEQAYPIATGDFYRLLYDSGRTYFVLRNGDVLATNAF